MDADDVPIGHVLSRREALSALTAAGAVFVGGGLVHGPAAAMANFPTCVVRPQQTEGPYYIDTKLNRSDIRGNAGGGKPDEGAELNFTIDVSQIGAGQCKPLAGAVVDVWQCDAIGIYSGVRDQGDRFNTTGQTFLRGHQITDKNGRATFISIYPGWYEGRTVHIHFKIRSSRADRAYEFTSQLYFDDEMTDEVMRLEPYASKGDRSIRNDRDGIFRRSGGAQLIMPVKRKANVFTGSFAIGLTF
jgi:protocatechuate 3,4-dioxygenase beta subunit